MYSWPSAPMLKRPARKPTATARPVKMSGVAERSVSEIGWSAVWISFVSPEAIAERISVGLPIEPVRSAW